MLYYDAIYQVIQKIYHFFIIIIIVSKEKAHLNSQFGEKSQLLSNFDEIEKENWYRFIVYFHRVFHYISLFRKVFFLLLMRMKKSKYDWEDDIINQWFLIRNHSFFCMEGKRCLYTVISIVIVQNYLEVTLVYNNNFL